MHELGTRVLAALAVVVVVGCGEGEGPRDGGPPDATAPLDAGASDAGAVTRDAGTDAGPLDGGAMDAGAMDAGAMDAGAMDDAGTDAGPPDAGADAGSADGGTDPDGDGVPTELELACGTDPDDGGDAPSPGSLRGDGTNADPFRICLPEHLALFAAEATVLGAHARLGDDLDFTGVALPDPIGAAGATYTGTFDGDGHVIRNLTVGASDAPRLGIFGAVGPGGVLRDLVFVSAVTFVGSPLVAFNEGTVSRVQVDAVAQIPDHGGLVVNRNLVGGLVEDCASTGSITGVQSHLGGLVGQNDGAITRSWSAVSVEARNRTGGLVGSGTGSIRESFATGAVTGRGMWIGGLIGSARDGSTTEDSFALGAVSAAGAAGGIAGNMEGTASLARVYSASAVTTTAVAGGVLGEDSSGGTATRTSCYFDTSITASDPGGCTGLSASEAAMQASYAGFDFTTPIWRMDGSVRATPVLHWE